MVEQIKIARKNKGWTQEQLASAIGVKRSVISKYENGTISPSADMLKSIASALDVDVVSLLTPVGVPSSAFMSFLDQKIIELVKLDYPSTLDFYNAFLNKEVSIMMLNGPVDRQLCNAYGKLNIDGQQKAVERVEELTEIPRYRRQDAAPPSTPTANTPGTSPPPESP